MTGLLFYQKWIFCTVTAYRVFSLQIDHNFRNLSWGRLDRNDDRKNHLVIAWYLTIEMIWDFIYSKMPAVRYAQCSYWLYTLYVYLSDAITQILFCWHVPLHNAQMHIQTYCHRDRSWISYLIKYSKSQKNSWNEMKFVVKRIKWEDKRETVTVLWQWLVVCLLAGLLVLVVIFFASFFFRSKIFA